MAAGLNRSEPSPFSSYRTYVCSLQELMNETGRGPEWNNQVFAALNGQASTELVRLATLESRRKYGAYFTGTTLTERLLAHCVSLESERVFYDPSCGMGDLLLAVARGLPLANTVSQTLATWGRRLAGTDLHAEFIEGAKTRLVLLALQRHRANETLIGTTDKLFPNIRVADGLVEEAAFQRATTLLMNPPFGVVPAPTGCRWAGGRVSEAAIFMVTALERVRRGTQVLAILPEVLRSGSFSHHWRNRVSELAEVHLIEPYGIFDNSADVDVFLLRLVRRASGRQLLIKAWPSLRKSRDGTVADYFDVHVGRVVPHRDPKKGRRCAYIHPRCVPTWSVMRDFSETRRHRSSPYQAPFVVIRRTSRPGDPYRATATIIAGKEPVAVENHLMVCEPKDKSLATCHELLLRLKTDDVNNFLNARIRCRHLTVKAIMDIPYRL